MAPAQDSRPTYPPPENLWTQLLEQVSSLPGNFDNFVATLEMRIGLLSDSNKRLMDSNLDLQTSNASLTESLRLSENRAEISEAKSKQLQTDLDASTRFITQAQNEAKAVAFQVAVLKIGCVTFGVGAAALGAYELGRHLWVWK